MKKLNKLEINPEKVLKNEELINLRGGGWCSCYNYDYMNFLGSFATTDWQTCYDSCWAMYDTGECTFDA